MARTSNGSPVKAGKRCGLFSHPLLRVGAAAGVVLVVTILVVSSALAAGHGSHSSNEVQFFQGAKTCQAYNSPPYVICTLTTSNMPLLLNASVAYISVPESFTLPAPGRDDSDVVLTTVVTTHGTVSKAYGHCTFYWATGTGICTYAGGTNALAGFHAALSIGTIDANAGIYSVIGKYWFEDSSGD